MAKRTLIAEETLVSMLSEKNPEGMEILYDNYAPALYGVIHRIIQEDEPAADVLKETFLKIWTQFRQYDPAKGSLFTWMISQARNQAIDQMISAGHHRDLKTRGWMQNGSESGLASRDAYNPETIGPKEMVRKLDPEYKQVIDLLFFGGFTQREVAEKLNIPLGTVKTRSRAALQKLRMQLNTMENS